MLIAKLMRHLVHNTMPPQIDLSQSWLTAAAAVAHVNSSLISQLRLAAVPRQYQIFARM